MLQSNFWPAGGSLKHMADSFGWTGQHIKSYLPAGSACSLGTAVLPESRPTSLELYRIESSISIILEGSSCFMLFHQSAAQKQHHIQPPQTWRHTEPGQTCAIPLWKIECSLRALFPKRRMRRRGKGHQRDALSFRLWHKKMVHTCSSSDKHKLQSGSELSGAWPTQGPELLSTPHLRAKMHKQMTMWRTLT